MVRTEISETLRRLTTTFTVRDIMIPKENLVRADNLSEAQHKLEINSDYDLIPIQLASEIKAFAHRSNPQKIKYIDLRELISDSTSLLELVDILEHRDFCFVLSGKNVSGYIHFSDLNNQLQPQTWLNELFEWIKP